MGFSSANIDAITQYPKSFSGIASMFQVFLQFSLHWTHPLFFYIPITLLFSFARQDMDII